MTRPTHIPKNPERHAGQAPFTCHRMDLQRRARKADRTEFAGLVIFGCALGMTAILIAVAVAEFFGGGW